MISSYYLPEGYAENATSTFDADSKSCVHLPLKNTARRWLGLPSIRYSQVVLARFKQTPESATNHA